jgi:DNA-directed RNA polymerase subunit beta
MITIKSDDIVGRAHAFEAIVKGVDIPASTVPESFKVLVRELNSLGLTIEEKGEIYKEEEVQEKKEEAMELAEVSGAEIVATEELTEDSSPVEIEESVN